MYQNKYLNLAIQEARLNPIKPIGRNSISRFAAIITDGCIVLTGRNSYRTHPLQAKFGVNEESRHVHAEIDALLKAIRWKARQAGSHYRDVTDLRGFRMAVGRVLKDGSPAYAKPCEGCQRALVAFRIEDVTWTT